MDTYTEIETLESFIKSEYADGKINEDTAREIIRMTSEIKDTIIAKK